MSYEIPAGENEQWEHEHEHRLIWICPSGCGYEYESERYVNEAMKCPTCDERCVSIGESYR